jgi:hypothetical protein
MVLFLKYVDCIGTTRCSEAPKAKYLQIKRIGFGSPDREGLRESGFHAASYLRLISGSRWKGVMSLPLQTLILFLFFAKLVDSRIQNPAAKLL